RARPPPAATYCGPASSVGIAGGASLSLRLSRPAGGFDPESRQPGIPGTPGRHDEVLQPPYHLAAAGELFVDLPGGLQAFVLQTPLPGLGDGEVFDGLLQGGRERSELGELQLVRLG